jgi:hypothetical protein
MTQTAIITLVVFLLFSSPGQELLAAIVRGLFLQLYLVGLLFAVPFMALWVILSALWRFARRRWRARVMRGELLPPLKSLR